MQIAFASLRSADATSHEDFVIASSNVVVILDGTSAPPGIETGCIHSVTWFVHQLGVELLDRFTMNVDLLPSENLAQAITNVNSHHMLTCDIMHPKNPSSAVAVLHEHEETIDFLVSGSTIVLFDEPGAVRMVSDVWVENAAGIEPQARHQKPTAPGTDDLRSPKPASQIPEYNHIDRMRPVSTNPFVAEHALTGVVNRRSLRRVAVLSAGAVRLAKNAGLVDWSRFLDRLEQDGPEGLIYRLRHVEATENDRQRKATVGASGDASAVVCHFHYPSQDSPD